MPVTKVSKGLDSLKAELGPREGGEVFVVTVTISLESRGDPEANKPKKDEHSHW